MARKQIPVTPVTHYTLVPDATATVGDATNNMWMNNDGATYINITSTSGSTQTVTVLVPGGADVNLTVGPRTYSVPANGKGKTGFFPVTIYGSQMLINVSSALVSFTAYTFAD